MYKKAALIICFFLSLFGSTPIAFAQGLSNGAATGIPINEKVKDGDIISSTPTGYTLTSSPYDSQIFGVVSLKPALYFKNATAKGETPVISNGEAMVLVSSKNGTIQSGDPITSSTTPGVGEKATDNGYVLGQARQSYSSNNPKATGLIRVSLQPHFAQINNNIVHNVFTSFTFGFSEALNSPLGAIRYFVAGLITLTSFYLGFRFFGRASNRGVEAIGRNPLARKAILLSVFVNTAITVSIMILGVAISYLILVL